MSRGEVGEAKVDIRLSLVEFEILMIWANNESHTSWLDKPTRKAMVEFAKRLEYIASAQLPPSVAMPKIGGDFS